MSLPHFDVFCGQLPSGRTAARMESICFVYCNVNVTMFTSFLRLIISTNQSKCENHSIYYIDITLDLLYRYIKLIKDACEHGQFVCSLQLYFSEYVIAMF